jgi:predicted Ser/Thr protein kinase
MSEAEASQNMENKCPKCGGPLPSGVLAGLCPACLFKQGAVTDTGTQPEAAPFQPPGVEEVSRLFPQLEILAFIGKGGMGAVYKARQPGLDRIVALKILPPQTAGGPGFVERFNREARALAKLTHANIVAVYEFGQVNGLPFFIMEFVDGLNLRQLEQAGQLSPRQALQIVPQICEALQFAHDEGIVHRDIKPENILIDKKGRVKIADFGIAKILGSGPDVAITETKGAIGTPHYMAPEQMEKPATVDHRADIFSLGVVFYEMLTGELPLGKFAPPSSCKVEVDVRLDDVVLRALEKDPERRYQHVSQVKTAVDTIATTAVPAPAANGKTLAQEILAHGYDLDIGSCVRRAWALVRSDFWPIIGVTALILALFAFACSVGGAFVINQGHGEPPAGSSVLGLLVYGPLMGGLSLYYLKKIRREPTTIETAFSGFSHRFLHLFLAGFVTWLLTALGFVCFILPGIYLAVAWWFTLTLVVDKQLDFWSAMELSRKVVNRHWWKFFAFWLLVLLMYALGIVVLLVGLFITAPIAMIAATYAYEDIFGVAGATAKQASAGVGPSGTVVMPGIPPRQPRPEGGSWKPERRAIVFTAWLLAMAVSLLFIAVARHRSRLRSEREFEARSTEVLPSSAFDAFVQRVRQELSRVSIRFSDLQVSQPRDNSFLVSFSSLEELGMVDGTNGWQSIVGSLAAKRAEGDKWEFYGQDKLQAVHFDIAELDAPILLQQSSDHNDAVSAEARQASRESLNERLEAASAISDDSARNGAMAAVATDAAKAGEVEIVKSSLPRIMDFTKQNETAYESVRLLAKHGMRKQALEIAKAIGDTNLRDKALSDLAQ